MAASSLALSGSLTRSTHPGRRCKAREIVARDQVSPSVTNVGKAGNVSVCRWLCPSRDSDIFSIHRPPTVSPKTTLLVHSARPYRGM